MCKLQLTTGPNARLARLSFKFMFGAAFFGLQEFHCMQVAFVVSGCNICLIESFIKMYKMQPGLIDQSELLWPANFGGVSHGAASEFYEMGR